MPRSDNVISLAPLPPRQTKHTAMVLPFFFFGFQPNFPEWHCRNPDWVLWDSGTCVFGISHSTSPPTLVSPRVSLKLRYGGTRNLFALPISTGDPCPGWAPRPLPAVWPVRHPKTVSFRPRFGRSFFSLCFYFVFRPSQAARRLGCERQRRRSSTHQCISTHTASWHPQSGGHGSQLLPSLSSRLSTRNPTPSKPWDEARHGAGYRKYDTTTRPI